MSSYKKPKPFVESNRQLEGLAEFDTLRVQISMLIKTVQYGGQQFEQLSIEMRTALPVLV